MSVNYLNSIEYIEIKNETVKKGWMTLLESLCGYSMEDHFYKVDFSKGGCNLDTPEYILIIPDEHKKIVFNALGAIVALVYSGSFNDICEKEWKTAD